MFNHDFVDFEKLKGYDTFGLNSAYRAYPRLNWWPTYHGCFDYVVTESHRNNFKKLIEEDNPIKRCFYLREISKNKKKQQISIDGNTRCILVFRGHPI